MPDRGLREDAPLLECARDPLHRDDEGGLPGRAVLPRLQPRRDDRHEKGFFMRMLGGSGS